ncbi:hypothetical protein ACWCYZ_45430, partial [Streptomyces virginiae]
MPDVRSPAGRPLLFLGVYLAVLTGAYENVGLGAVFPGIARQLGGSDNVAVYITAFSSTAFVSTVLAGRRAGRGGFVPLFLQATAVQLAGLAVCATAAGNAAFVLGRALQGLGEGAITVLAFLALTRFTHTETARARALAGLSVAWLLASALSPAALLVLPGESPGLGMYYPQRAAQVAAAA